MTSQGANLIDDAGPLPDQSFATDSIYNELGLPAIKIGPCARRISARNEEIDVDVMIKAAQISALMALDICTRTRAVD